MEPSSLLELSLCKLVDEEDFALSGTVSVRLRDILSISDILSPISSLCTDPMSGVSDDSPGGGSSNIKVFIEFMTTLGEESKLSFGLKTSMSEILDITELFLEVTDVTDFLCTVGVRPETNHIHR